MKIKQLTRDDVNDYKNIRLEALYNNPDSFVTMYDEEAKKTIDKFRERIPVDNNSFILGCYQDKYLVGIIAFDRESRIKVRHKAFIRSMYVRSEYRQKLKSYLNRKKIIKNRH